MHESLKELSQPAKGNVRKHFNVKEFPYLQGEIIFDDRRLLNPEDRRVIKFSGWKWFRNKNKLNFRYLDCQLM